MAYKPFPFTEFGGLDLRSAPDDSACIDLLDVDLDQDGRLRSRDLWDSYITTTLTSPRIHEWTGQNYLAVSAGVSLDLYNGSAAVATGIAAPETFTSAQPFGTTTTNYLYLASDASAIRRLTTAGVLSAPAGMPTARFVSRQATDNRLVAAKLSTNAHRVQFSNAGDAETWGANDWVDLDPGDGEVITAAVPWRDLFFIFKQTKFFVFYGNSTDSSGNPVFNYRAIRAGVGSGAYEAVAGPDGIYFNDPLRGVFRTTGGPPTCVSTPLDPILKTPGGYPPLFTYGRSSEEDRPCFVGSRFCMPVQFVDSSLTFRSAILVFDADHGFWTVWTANATSSIPSIAHYNGYLIFAATGANATVYRLDPTNATDDVGTVNSRYRSGFTDMGVHDEKRIAAWDIWGTGTVDLKTARDFGALGSATSFALGTSPAIARRLQNKAVDGTLFSWQLSGTGAWTVQRVVPRLNAARTPTTKTP